jgi:hypothetical protein
LLVVLLVGRQQSRRNQIGLPIFQLLGEEPAPENTDVLVPLNGEVLATSL